MKYPIAIAFIFAGIVLLSLNHPIAGGACLGIGFSMVFRYREQQRQHEAAIIAAWEKREGRKA